MTDTTLSDTDHPHSQRRAWLAVLAHAPRAALAEHAEAAVAAHGFDWLREPETGLALVRARIANRATASNWRGHAHALHNARGGEWPRDCGCGPHAGA